MFRVEVKNDYTNIRGTKRQTYPEMVGVAEKEGLSHAEILEKVASGRVVILKNNRRENVIPTAVGEGTTLRLTQI